VNLIEGDGSLPATITANASGVATLSYSFDGQLGHAVVQLLVPGVDTIQVLIRTEALVPGVGGQGSYVLFDERYGQAKQWLGEPVSVDWFASFPGAVYANYESTLGVVLILYDLDNDRQAYDTSSIFGVIVTELFDGRTLTTPPVQIGSTMDQIRQVYGPPDTAYAFDTAGTFVYRYPQYGMIIFGDVSVNPDTAVVQFTLTEDVAAAPPVPDRIVPLNGQYYTTGMRGFVSQNSLQFIVEDTAGFRIGNVDLLLSQVEGDGAFTGNQNDTVRTDPTTGVGTFAYSFNGSLGHSIMRLTLPDVDTLDVYLRSNVLIPGAGGQAQYVLFDDTWADVRAFDGDPASVDTTGAFGGTFVYANYRDVLGVTAAFYDDDRDDQLFDTSQVYGVVLDTAYTGTTFGGIGLYSTFSELQTAYGAPDSIVAALADTVSIFYGSQFARFDAVVGADTTVVRVLLAESAL
jgi:hypothetical protein